MHSIITYTEATDAVGPELITLDELKLHLGITTTTEDERLEAAITLASELIATYCGRRFAFAYATETFSFDPCEESRKPAALTLELYPVVAIESVMLDGADLDETSYQLDAAKGMLWSVGDRWSGTIIVTYSGGYALPDEAPAALTAAVIEAIRLRQFTAASGRDPSISSLSHGDTRVSYFESGSTNADSGFSPTVINLLNPFRHPTFA